METTVEIERMGFGGPGIAHTAEGKTVFVKGGVAQDVVRIALDEEKPAFCTAHIIEILRASPWRIAPACPLSGQCGGCPWMHIAYGAQTEAKRANVVAALVHTAGFTGPRAEALVSPCVPSKRETGYRNKLEFACAQDGQERLVLGFHAEGSHDLVALDACPLAHESIQHAPKALRGALRYCQGSQDLGIFRVGVRASVRTRDIEIALWTHPGPFPRNPVADTLKSALPATSIVRVLADGDKARRIKGTEVLAGKGFWEEDLAGYRLKTSAPSFFQVNTAQAEALVDAVVAGLEVEGASRVADLYAGGGTFSLPLAGRAHTVFAVESAGASVRDLRRNAQDNGADIEVIGGDSARELPSLGKLDALVVDPPRSGLAKGVVQSIAAAGPKRVAYVSCNPATWARDVAAMEQTGYCLTRVLPVDLFPQSYHTEIVSIFAQEDPHV